MSDDGHSERILDQFTRQAPAFSAAAMITDDTVLAMIVERAGAGAGDTVLDVACGPGIVVCAFAPHVQHATGVDFTPAMHDRARRLAAEKGLHNVAWDQGDAYRLRETLGGLLRQPLAAVVSGLPLFTKPLRMRLRLLRESLSLLRPAAPFVQFTYAVVPPIPKSASGVHAEASERIWMNLPPARVWVYRKR